MRKKQFINEFLPLSDKVYKLAYRFLNDQDEAKDLVQQIYLKLWDKRNELKSFNNNEAYVIKMTRNACLDKLKLAKDKVDIANYGKSEDAKYDSIESVEVIRRIIENLPNLQQRIIELRDIDGYTFDEIAELLDLSINSIRVSLSIARKKVRKEFLKIYSYGLQTN